MAAATATDEIDCIKRSSDCRWNGISCMDAASCSDYVAIGHDEAVKKIYCLKMRDNQTPAA